MAGLCAEIVRRAWCQRMDAPLARLILVELPIAPELVNANAPAEMQVVPEYVLAALNVSTPKPAWVRLPLPLITFPTVRLSYRLKMSVALSVTLPVPREPVVPPSPI